MLSRDRQSVRLRKFYDGLVIRLRRPETLREFRRREKFMKIRAVRVLQLLEQLVQLALIPQRQTDCKRKAVGRGQMAKRREPRNNLRHMAVQRFSRHRLRQRRK